MGKVNHELFMKRCLELASLATGMVAPNPLVGSVIVKGDRIIGEGWHNKYGGNHAEVNAIDSVKDKSLLTSSVLYVNLEPCSHYGKTPPCSRLIAEMKIPEVVVGTTDTNSLISGKGIRFLRDKGIKVITGVHENFARIVNRRYFTFQEKKRPYIILKWAQSADRFLDVDRELYGNDRPVWITSETSRSVVHKWRASEQAVLVGANTVEKDDPILNVRSWTGKNPLRIVIDPGLRLSHHFRVFDKSQPTIVINSKRNNKNGLTEFIKVNFCDNPEHKILDLLYKRGIQSLIIEGGEYTLNRFINNGLWDEARVFTGDSVFGSGVPAPPACGILNDQLNIMNSRLELFLNPG